MLARAPGLTGAQVPVSVVWGAADPWEKVEWGRDFVPANYASITDFTELPGVGHCPMVRRPSRPLSPHEPARRIGQLQNCRTFEDVCEANQS